MTKEPKFLVVDLFCGAGGTSTGYARTNGIAKVIACVNHDPTAIKSHWHNYPRVRHFEEDIRTLDLTRLISVVKYWQRRYPNAKLILWASLECTNFSKAKGGLPRDADSRTLADHLVRYITALNPDIIKIENVVEFMSWGPLDANGKPVSKKNGSDWLRWRKEICLLGYVDEWKELNSADFGAYTSRNRLFGMFAKDPAYICWPEPTHCKNPSTGALFSAPKKWKPVKEVLDLQDEGKSIFGRKKELSDNTLERIYAGLLKYVAGGKDAFIQKYYSGKPEGKVISLDGPAGTIATAGNQALVKANFILKYNSTDKNGNHTPPSVEDPCPTIACQNRLGVVNTTFLTKYYGAKDQVSSIEHPAGTLSTKDRMATVKVQWLDKQYSGSDNHQSLENPAGSVMPNPKSALISADPFIMNTNYSNVGKSIEEPCPTLTASRRHHYIINPAWGGNNGDIENPCCTIVARQDKAPLYIVAIEHGEVAVEVYDTDSEIMIKIKEFMCIYGIVDIKMRMLKVLELLLIQGFPENYVLIGNQTEQKKAIGNSVVPHIVTEWTIAIDNNLKIAA